MRIVYTCNEAESWLKKQLELQGHHVIVASTFDDVLPLLRQEAFQVIIWEGNVDHEDLSHRQNQGLIRQIQAEFPTILQLGYTACWLWVATFRQLGCRMAGMSTDILPLIQQKTQ